MHAPALFLCFILCVRACWSYEVASCTANVLPDTRHILDGDVATTHCPDVRSIHCADGTNNFYAWNYETPREMRVEGRTPAGTKLLTCDDVANKPPIIPVGGPFRVMPLIFFGVMIPDGSDTFYCIYDRLLQTYDPCAFDGSGVFDFTRCRAGVSNETILYGGRSQVWLRPSEPRAYDMYYMRDEHERFSQCGSSGAPSCIHSTQEMWCSPPEKLRKAMSGTECYCSFPTVRAAVVSELVDMRESVDPWSDSCSGGPRTIVGDTFVETLPPFNRKDVTSNAWPGTTLTCPPPGYIACVNDALVSMDGTFATTLDDRWTPFWKGGPGSCIISDSLDVRFVKMHVGYATQLCEADYAGEKWSTKVHNDLAYSHGNTSVTSITCSYAYGSASILSGTTVTMTFIPDLLGSTVAGSLAGFVTGPWSYSGITRATELGADALADIQTATCVPDAAAIYASDDHRVRSADTCACLLRGITYRTVGYVPRSTIPYMGCCGVLATDAGRVYLDGATGGVAGREAESHCHSPARLVDSPGKGMAGVSSYGAAVVLPPLPDDMEDVTLACPPPSLLECVEGLWFASSGFAEIRPSSIFTCKDAELTAPIVFDAAYLQIDSQESPTSSLRCTYTVPLKHRTAANPVWEVRLHLVRAQVFQQHAALFVPATTYWGKRFGYQWDCNVRNLAGSNRNTCRCAVTWRKAVRLTESWAIPFMWSRCCKDIATAPSLDQPCLDGGRVMLACPAADRLSCSGSRVIVSNPDPESSSAESNKWSSSLLLCSQATDAEPSVACQGRRTLGNTVITACPLGSGAFKFRSVYYDDKSVACSYQLLTNTALKDVTFIRIVTKSLPTRRPKLSPGVKFAPFVSGMRCIIPLSESATQLTPELGCPFYATPSNLFSTREAGNANRLMAVPPPPTNLVYHYATCPPASVLTVKDGLFSLVLGETTYGTWVRAEYAPNGRPYDTIDMSLYGWPTIVRISNTVHEGRTTVVCEYVLKSFTGGLPVKHIGLRYNPGLTVYVKSFAARQDDCVIQSSSTPHTLAPVCECYKDLTGNACECAVVNGQHRYRFETSEPLVDHCVTPLDPPPLVACPPAAVIRCDHARGFYMDIAMQRLHAVEATILGAPGIKCWKPSNISQAALLHTVLYFVPDFSRVRRWDCAYRISGTACDSEPTADVTFTMHPFANNIVAHESEIVAAGCDKIFPQRYSCINLALGECDSVSTGAMRIYQAPSDLALVGDECCEDVSTCILEHIQDTVEPPTKCASLGSTAMAIPLSPYIPPYTDAVQKGLQCMKGSVKKGIGESITETGGNSAVRWTEENVRWASCPDPVRDIFCTGLNNADFRSGNFLSSFNSINDLGDRVTVCPAQHTTGETSKLAPGWALILVEIEQGADLGLVFCYYSNQYNTIKPDFFVIGTDSNLFRGAFRNNIGTFTIDSLYYNQLGAPSITPADKTFVYSVVQNTEDLKLIYCARAVGPPLYESIDWFYFDALPTCGCPFLLVDTGLSPTTADGLLLNSFGCAYDHLWSYWSPLTTCPPLDCLQFNAGKMFFPGFECVGDSCSRNPDVATKFHFAKARLFTSGRLRCIYAYYTSNVELVVFDSAPGRLYASASDAYYAFIGDPNAGEPNSDCCYDYIAGAPEGVSVSVSSGVPTSVVSQVYKASTARYISGLREPYTDMAIKLWHDFTKSECDSKCPVNICPTDLSTGKYNGALYNNVELGTVRMCPPPACVYDSICPARNAKTNILSCQFVPGGSRGTSTCSCEDDYILLTTATFIRADYRRKGQNTIAPRGGLASLTISAQYVECVYEKTDTKGVKRTFYLDTVGIAVPGTNFDLYNIQYPPLNNKDAFDYVFASCTPITGNSDCAYYQSTSIRMPYDASYPDGVFPCTGFDCTNCRYEEYMRPLALPSPSPTPYPSPSPSPTPYPSPSPSPIILPSPSPTPTPFPSPSPIPSPLSNPSPSPSPSPAPIYGPTINKIIRRIETYMTITTCPPASCLTQFAMPVSPAAGTTPGTFTLQVPNFPQCSLNSVPCNASLATYDTTFARVDVWYRPESIENPECSYVECSYTNVASDSLVLTTRFADHTLLSPAYIPAISRSSYWEVAFQHDTCSAGTQDLECACPLYRTHGVQVAWDSQGCCCDIVANPECDVVFGPIPKLSGVCQDASSCRAFQPIPNPSPPPPVIVCPPPPIVRKQSTTCPPSSIITYGNNGWYVDGDDADSYVCDPDHSNGCVVDGRILDSSVAFRQLEIVLDGKNVSYLACSYKALIVRGNDLHTMFITMSATAPADYTPNYSVVYAPDDNPAVLVCNTPLDQFQRDVCACPFEVRVQKTADSWAPCCCDGQSFAPCVLAGIPCPIPDPPISVAAHHRVALGAIALLMALIIL